MSGSLPGRAAAVFSLAHHANYACRHSGVCCSAGWTIPVEPECQALLGVSELPQPAGGTCQFYDRKSTLCGVHRDYGESAMPASCRHFPRRALIDNRGAFVTLSHFCPTATAMLFEAPGPLRIVESPPAFPAAREWDGLDARGQWPPLVSPGVLFDLDTYSAFEQFIIATLARPCSVRDALQTVAGAVERMREWNQRRGSFMLWAAEAFALATRREVVLPGRASRMGALLLPPHSMTRVYVDVLRTVPAHHEPVPLQADAERAWSDLTAPVWDRYSSVVKRYVAAKGFGSWTAYQGRGARTLVAEMTVADTVLQATAASACAREERRLDDGIMHEAIRAADWLLVHLVDRQPFVEWLGEVEHLPS